MNLRSTTAALCLATASALATHAGPPPQDADGVAFDSIRVIDARAGCTHGSPEQHAAARAAIERFRRVHDAGEVRSLVGSTERPLTGLDIVLDLSAAVASDPAFVATLERAVSRWETVVRSPVRIRYAVDFTTGEPFVAAASSSILGNPPYPDVRAALQSRSGPDTIAYISALPVNNPLHIGQAGLNTIPIYADPRALRKALGLSDPTDISQTDATIVFNTDFTFDLDNADGTPSGAIDLESVMVHEIGHAMGFVSGVDSQFIRVTLDLFRFGINGASNDPGTLADISSAALPREMRIGVEAALDTVGAIPPYTEAFRFSTGTNGDGRQGSHWKADELLGLPVPIGVMDPTVPLDALAPGYLTDADRLAFRLIGWDIELPGASACDADWNSDGLVDAFDLLDYLRDYDAGDTATDIAPDGLLDADDVRAFLLLLEEPCP